MDITTVKGLAALFIAVLQAINPAAPHTGSAGEVAAAAAYAVAKSDPPEGYDRGQMIAVLASMAWNESRLNPRAIGPAWCRNGDCKAYGAWQAEHRPYLLGDATGQALFEYDLIRRSARACPAHILAMVTSGSCAHHGVADKRLEEALKALAVASSGPVD